MIEPELREVDAFLTTLDSIPPNAVTACRGWTTHEIVAHLSSGAVAFADQVEAHLDGRPVPEFDAWDTFPAFQALDDAVLRRRLQSAEQRMTAAFDVMLTENPEAVVPEVGFGFPIAELVTHMRQEFAVHRWDLVGDDETSAELLSRPYLIEHSVRMLAGSLLEAGLAQDSAAHRPFTVRLRCPDTPDLVLDVHDRVGALSWREPEDAINVVETDAPGRLLILWGRKPADARRVRSGLAPEQLARLQNVLIGF